MIQETVRGFYEGYYLDLLTDRCRSARAGPPSNWVRASG